MGITLGLLGASRLELGTLLAITTLVVESAMAAYLFWRLRALMNAPRGKRGWY